MSRTKTKQKRPAMAPRQNRAAMTSRRREGKIRYGVAAWLVGLPLPFILLAMFFRGCDW